MPIVTKAKPAKPKATKPEKHKATKPAKPKASIASPPKPRAKAPPKPKQEARSGIMKAMDILDFQTLTPQYRTYRGYTPVMMKKERAYLKTMETPEPKKGEIARIYRQNK